MQDEFYEYLDGVEQGREDVRLMKMLFPNLNEQTYPMVLGYSYQSIQNAIEQQEWSNERKLGYIDEIRTTVSKIKQKKDDNDA